MNALLDNIATETNVTGTVPSTVSRGVNDISTETQTLVDPAWTKCIDALEEIWKDPSQLDDGLVTPPTREAVEAAIAWLMHLRDQLLPPPTLVAPEPAGGIMFERCATSESGAEICAEFTFNNDRTAENTVYRSNKVVHLASIPFWPPRVLE